MKDAKIYINGYIGEPSYFDTEDTCFSLVNLNAKLAEIGEVDVLDIYINSGGGSVTEGFAIYDKLMSLDCTVNTIVNGMCGSIATIIFQAGQKGTRKMFENSEFFVHNPHWSPQSPDAMEAKDIATLHEDLLKAEQKILSFYATITGKTEDELKPLLDRQTTLTSTEAIEWGFVDEKIETKIKAFTKYKLVAFLNNNKTTMEKETKEELTSIKRFLAKITKKLFKNASRKTDEGKDVFFDGSIVVGSEVFEDEAMTIVLADGTYKLDTIEIVVVGGVVTELTEITPAPTAEQQLAEANAKIEELIASLATQATLVAEKETLLDQTKTELLAFAGKVKQFEAMLVTGKDFKPNGSQFENKKPVVTDETPMQKYAREKKEKRELEAKK